MNKKTTVTNIEQQRAQNYLQFCLTVARHLIGGLGSFLLKMVDSISISSPVKTKILNTWLYVPCWLDNQIGKEQNEYFTMSGMLAWNIAAW